MSFREVKKGEKPKIIDKSKPVEPEKPPAARPRSGLSSPAILSLGFFILIAIGTGLLSLPVATHQPISVLSAAFTATSAVTVTGLNVVDTGNYTTFGQMVIIALIQFGGLGFMTFAILAVMSLSPKLGLKQQIMAQETIGQTSLKKVTFTIKGVFLYSLFFEAAGTVILDRKSTRLNSSHT